MTRSRQELIGMENTEPATNDAAQMAATATATARDLGRLLSCAGMYPAGHPLLDEAAERAVQHTSNDKSGPLVLAVTQDGLAVRSQLVDIEDRESGRLHDHLLAIGIARIRLDEGVTIEEMHQFATGLLQAKTEVMNSSGFVSVDVSSHLPASFWIEMRGFGARTANEEAATARVLSALGDVNQGDQTELMAQAVDLLVPHIVERFDDEYELDATSQATPGIGLDEVLDLCATALRAGVEDLLSSGGQLGDLPSLIKATEHAFTSADDPEAMGLMIEVLRQAAEEAANSGALDAAIDESMDIGYVMTMDELRVSFAELHESAEPLDHTVRSTELAQTLSIVLQLCQDHPSQSVMDGVRDKLQPTHGTKWGSREANILEAGVRSLLEPRDVALLDDVLPALLESLRTDGTELLPRVMKNFAQSATEMGAGELLWPHVVNQILLGLRPGERKRSKHRDDSELSRFVSSFDPMSNRELLNRLAGLVAIREHRIAEDVLALREPDVYPVLASMLNSPDGRRFGDYLFRALHKRPMAWPGAHALQCAISCSSKVRQFILELLATDGQFETSASAARLAASIMADSIQSLPEQRREEDWIPKTLRILARLDPEDTDGLLKRVMNERKHFRRVWPKACRVAVEQALRPGGGNQ